MERSELYIVEVFSTSGCLWVRYHETIAAAHCDRPKQSVFIGKENTDIVNKSLRCNEACPKRSFKGKMARDTHQRQDTGWPFLPAKGA